MGRSDEETITRSCSYSVHDSDLHHVSTHCGGWTVVVADVKIEYCPECGVERTAGACPQCSQREADYYRQQEELRLQQQQEAAQFCVVCGDEAYYGNLCKNDVGEAF